MKAADLAKLYRIKDGTDFRLERIDPSDTCGLDIEKAEAKEQIAADIKEMKDLQEKLYAEGKWALLIVLQAMDAAGKDSAIEHVMSGINPQGCEVRSFKAPSSNELKHDFLWRHARVLPERGRIGIFNRSHYEEVLVVRVHPEILEGQNIPDQLVGEDVWQTRFKDIRAFERHLANNGTVILKFFLHVSRNEQARRFLDRIEEPDKNWKFSASDISEREHWDDYMRAYEDMIQNTARAHAPWHVVPSDNKWFARMVIAATIVEALERIDPKFPEVSDEAIKRMQEDRKVLKKELDHKD
ncbi:polyphosphate kinase 2 family protein [Hoeflea sp. CAU 1731]